MPPITASGRAGSIQIHGAYGFSDEYPVERYLRNSKGAVIYEGTSEIHQLMQADYALGYREDARCAANCRPMTRNSGRRTEWPSPESHRRDRVEKFAEYERGGVPEYWILDPVRQETLFYVLNADGIYEPVEPDAKGACITVACSADSSGWLPIMFWQVPLAAWPRDSSSWSSRC
jgi:hypothetical protein